MNFWIIFIYKFYIFFVVFHSGSEFFDIYILFEIWLCSCDANVCKQCKYCKQIQFGGKMGKRLKEIRGQTENAVEYPRKICYGIEFHPIPFNAIVLLFCCFFFQFFLFEFIDFEIDSKRFILICWQYLFCSRFIEIRTTLCKFSAFYICTKYFWMFSILFVILCKIIGLFHILFIFYIYVWVFVCVYVSLCVNWTGISASLEVVKFETFIVVFGF